MSKKNKSFTVLSIGRSQIAVLLNEFLTRASSSVDRFKLDDRRLTDDFCQRYADEYGQALEVIEDDAKDADASHHDDWIDDLMEDYELIPEDVDAD